MPNFAVFRTAFFGAYCLWRVKRGQVLVDPKRDLGRIAPGTQPPRGIFLAALLTSFAGAAEDACDDGDGSKTSEWEQKGGVSGGCSPQLLSSAGSTYLSSFPGIVYVTLVGSPFVSTSPIVGMFSCAHSCSSV